MTATLIDGKALAETIKASLALRVQTNLQNGMRKPGLAVILVGDDPASHIYVKNKQKACVDIGIYSLYHHLAANTSENELILLIEQLNNNASIDGILLQLPLPLGIDANKIIDHIHPQKDVDGFHAYNLGRLAQRRPLFRPCTPRGIIMLLDHIGETYKGKHAVVVGASNIVGRPMMLEFLIAGATVTICHRLTQDLAKYVALADILVTAVGIPQLIKGAWIKPHATVIDVGITRRSDGSLAGDVEFKEALAKAAWITPVPGGVGPMTVAMLMQNTIEAAEHFNA